MSILNQAITDIDSKVTYYYGRPFKRRKEARLTLSEVIRARTMNGREIANFLLDVMRGKQIPLQGTQDGQGEAPTLHHRLAAAEMLLNRGWGRPKEEITVIDQDAGRPDYSHLSTEELQAVAALMRQAKEIVSAHPGDRVAPIIEGESSPVPQIQPPPAEDRPPWW